MMLSNGAAVGRNSGDVVGVTAVDVVGPGKTGDLIGLVEGSVAGLVEGRGNSGGQHASRHEDESVEFPEQMHPKIRFRREMVDVHRSKHPLVMPAFGSHLVAQFSGSTGPTDPSGHVLTMGIPSGADVGIVVSVGVGIVDAVGVAVSAIGDEVGESVSAVGTMVGVADSSTQGKITGKHSGEKSLGSEHGFRPFPCFADCVRHRLARRVSNSMDHAF